MLINLIKIGNYYNDIWIFIIERNIGVDIVVGVRELLILMLSDPLHIFPCHVTSECCLNSHNDVNGIWVSKPIGKILITLRLNVVRVYITLTATC